MWLWQATSEVLSFFHLSPGNHNQAKQLFHPEWFGFRYAPLISHGRLPRKITLASLGTRLEINLVPCSSALGRPSNSSSFYVPDTFANPRKLQADVHVLPALPTQSESLHQAWSPFVNTLAFLIQVWGFCCCFSFSSAEFVLTAFITVLGTESIAANEDNCIFIFTYQYNGEKSPQ